MDVWLNDKEGKGGGVFRGLLRSTTQPNHPTVKSLSFESAQQSEPLSPHLLKYAPTDEKMISADIFMTVREKKGSGMRSEAYFQHGARLKQVYFGWSSHGF